MTIILYLTFAFFTFIIIKDNSDRHEQSIAKAFSSLFWPLLIIMGIVLSIVLVVKLIKGE